MKYARCPRTDPELLYQLGRITSNAKLSLLVEAWLNPSQIRHEDILLEAYDKASQNLLSPREKIILVDAVQKIWMKLMDHLEVPDSLCVALAKNPLPSAVLSRSHLILMSADPLETYLIPYLDGPKNTEALYAIWQRSTEGVRYDATYRLLSQENCPQEVYRWVLSSQDTHLIGYLSKSSHAPDEVRVEAALASAILVV